MAQYAVASREEKESVYVLNRLSLSRSINTCVCVCVCVCLSVCLSVCLCLSVCVFMFILFSTGAVAFRYVAVEEEVVGMRMWKRRRSYAWE